MRRLNEARQNHLHILRTFILFFYKYIVSKCNAYNLNAHTHAHADHTASSAGLGIVTQSLILPLATRKTTTSVTPTRMTIVA